MCEICSVCELIPEAEWNMNGFAFAIDELSFPVRAEGRLAANQESENRFGNMANISARAEIPQQGGSPWDAVGFL